MSFNFINEGRPLIIVYDKVSLLHPILVIVVYIFPIVQKMWMWCFLFILLFLFRFVLVGVKVGLLSNRANMLANFFVERDRGTGGVFSKILFFLSSSCLRLTYLQMFREVIPFSYSNMTMV